MLPMPCRYFPIEKGVYEVAPGLRSLGQDLGNGARDALAFQLDSEFAVYRANKLECRAERLTKYCVTSEHAPEVSTEVNRFLVTQLVQEHPTLFRLQRVSDTDSSVEWLFRSELTQEELRLDARFEFPGHTPQKPGAIEYASAFDAICSQIQEDVAVTRSDDAGRDWLSAIHLCSAGHWAAEDKIGKSFVDVHLPVPGIEKINRAASSLVDAMIHKGPYVRFVWGFATDRRLNHHPEPAPGWSRDEWRGRAFDVTRGESPFILRVERQVTWGLPSVRAAIFLIRVYFIDGNEIRSNSKERALLRSGLLSMSEASRAYKGLAQCMDEVIAWLDS